MEIRGPLPFHVAKAYGVVKTPAAAVAHGAASGGASGGATRLVAGTVSVPADPSLASNTVQGTASSGSRQTDAFPMYSRAADRVEVATAVALGRNLDMRG